MKTPNPFLSLIFIILAFSCQTEKGYVITVNITGLPDSTLFYLQDPSTQENLDTATLILGKMEFRGRFAETPVEVFLMSAGNDPFIYTYMLIGNEDVKIEGDMKDFPFKVQITGSKTQDDRNILTRQTADLDVKRNAMVEHFFTLPEMEQEKQGKQFGTQLDRIDSITHALKVGFVQKHYNTFAGLLTLWELKKSLPKDTVQAILSKLPPDLKNHKYATGIEAYMKNDVLQIGDLYRDFEAENPEGKPVKLSEILDRNVLLDFTSAGCGPCILAAEELRQIDSTCSDSLRIVSFNVDSKKDSWLSSLKRDHITWTSMWDGKGVFSDTYIVYGVSGYPTFVLINSNGKIINWFVGYGKGSLFEKLNRYRNQ
jgi:thiol-disulfide isomerase/thioredoxin